MTVATRTMFSLHIDTARTWRGGQNQVLLTVNGLRAIGQRAALVAHPDGELRRRAAEGLELIPLAPRTEMDLSAAWRLSRVDQAAAPDVIHAHDPHGVAMAALALSLGAGGGEGRPTPALVASRRVDFHLKGNSFSRWKYRQVDCFIAASEAIRQMLVADGVPPTGRSPCTKASTSSTCVAAPPVNVHEAFWLPHGAPVVGNVAALVPHKGQRYLIDAAHLVVQQMPDARFVILGEGELREHLERQVREHHLEKHVLLPGFRTDVLGCIKGFDLFVMSSVTEGLGTSLLDAMACSRPIVATRAGGIPGDRRGRRQRAAGAAARSRTRWPTRSSALLKDAALRQRMGEAGFARVQRALHRRADGRRDRRGVRSAWPADPTQRTLRSPPARRLKPHAFIIPRWQSEKSYFTGSSGSSRAQRRGDVARHPPARAGVARQPQAAADANHVRVERHDQLRRRHARPDAEIERVAPHHPAQEQIQPLAAAARRRPRKEVADARPLRHAAVRGVQIERQRARRKAVERVRDIVGAPDRSLRERTLRSIPTRSSICRITHSSATMSAPRVQRWTMPAKARRVARADRSGARTRPARARSPPARARSTAARSTRGRTPAPRRRTPTTSRSSSRVKRRTI